MSWAGSPLGITRLGVLPRAVGDAAGGWVAAERGVCAVVIVGGEPPGKGCAAVGLASVRAGVGPLIQQCPVEPLGLAVGLGPVGAGSLVHDPGGGKGVAP